MAQGFLCSAILTRPAAVVGVIVILESLHEVVLKTRVPFRVLFIRVPYSFGDLKRDPNSDNYPHDTSMALVWGELCSV